jgi:hypothetical protein
LVVFSWGRTALERNSHRGVTPVHRYRHEHIHPQKSLPATPEEVARLAVEWFIKQL